VLWETTQSSPSKPIRFHTRNGVLTAEHRRGWIELDFLHFQFAHVSRRRGWRIVSIVRSSLSAIWARYLCEVADEETLRSLDPDFQKLRGIRSGSCRHLPFGQQQMGLRVTFSLRLLSGLRRPCDGSAHCALGPYWAAPIGQTELVGYQASSRGGTVRVGFHNDRVHISDRPLRSCEAK